MVPIVTGRLFFSPMQCLRPFTCADQSGVALETLDRRQWLQRYCFGEKRSASARCSYRAQLQSASSRSTMRRSFAGFGSLVNRAFGGQKWADLDNFLFFYHSGP